jgi:type II secretory pathway predicted ATPase ExeA
MTLFPSREALLRTVISYVFEGRVIVPIRGARGIGKTMLARSTAARLQAGGWVAILSEGSRRSPMDVHRALAAAAGLTFDPIPSPQIIFQHLTNAEEHYPITLVIDDADNLSCKVYRYISLLLAFAKFNGFKLQLVLFGENGSWPGLADGDLVALHRDMVSTDFILPLSEKEAGVYLSTIGGGPGGSHQLGRAAMRCVLKDAKGVPGRLDELTLLALEGHARYGWARLLRDYIALIPRYQGRPWHYATTAAIVLAVIVTAGVQLEQPMQSPEPVIERIDANDLSSVSGAALSPTPPIVQDDEFERMTAALDMSRASPAAEPIIASEFGSAPAASATPPIAEAAPAITDGSKDPVQTNAKTPVAVPQTLVPPAEPDTLWKPEPGPAFDARRLSGLLIVAQPGDTVASVYHKIYRGVLPPPFAEVLAINKMPIKPGNLIVLPEPPQGWSSNKSDGHTGDFPD